MKRANNYEWKNVAGHQDKSFENHFPIIVFGNFIFDKIIVNALLKSREENIFIGGYKFDLAFLFHLGWQFRGAIYRYCWGIRGTKIRKKATGFREESQVKTDFLTSDISYRLAINVFYRIRQNRFVFPQANQRC